MPTMLLPLSMQILLKMISPRRYQSQIVPLSLNRLANNLSALFNQDSIQRPNLVEVHLIPNRIMNVALIIARTQHLLLSLRMMPAPSNLDLFLRHLKWKVWIVCGILASFSRDLIRQSLNLRPNMMEFTLMHLLLLILNLASFHLD